MTLPTATLPTATLAIDRWSALAHKVLDGHLLTEAEGMEVLQSHDDEILDVMAAAFRIRRAHFGKTVQFYYLMNAKSGLCPEDCSYCSQSKISTAEIPKYNILSRDKLLDGARIASEQNAKTYCIVISARGPSEREVNAVEKIIPEIKAKYDLKICACLGLLDDEQAERLKACGVDRVNHNVNTSESYYDKICSTHTYEDRIQTLNAVRNAGLEICSGGIIGMGEQPIDIVKMALELRDIGAVSIPLNFLIPIDGTPLEGNSQLTPRDCLRALAMFRFANPDRELRIAGGRELHLGTLQPLGLYAANSVFVGDYLTTKGQLPEEDIRMVREMGFEVTKQEEVRSA
jgi:biotin synthase